MYESFLQLRIEEIHAEMLREASAWRLAKEARDGQAGTGVVARLRRVAQRTEATASATRRTPSSMSDAVTAP